MGLLSQPRVLRRCPLMRYWPLALTCRPSMMRRSSIRCVKLFLKCSTRYVCLGFLFLFFTRGSFAAYAPSILSGVPVGQPMTELWELKYPPAEVPLPQYTQLGAGQVATDEWYIHVVTCCVRSYCDVVKWAQAKGHPILTLLNPSCRPKHRPNRAWSGNVRSRQWFVANHACFRVPGEV